MSGRGEPASSLGGWVRGLRARSHLWSAAAVGGALFLALPGAWPGATRALLAWDAGALVYLALVGTLMARTDIAGIRERVHHHDYDEARWTILLITVAGAAASGWGIVAELARGTGTGWWRGASVGLAVATVTLSWTMVHVMFAIHYAHEYYGGGEGKPRAGLRMPGGADPGYGDFLYTAFVIGCGNQTADVEFTTPAMRRVALAHGVVSFVFNTAILALMVNIAAALFGPSN